jgi:predicted aspartyl protease
VALIDTGASVICIDESAAQTLTLPAIDVVTVASASHAASPQNVYPIQVDVAGLPVTISAPRVVGASLAAQGLLLLIGRDVLQQTYWRMCTSGFVVLAPKSICKYWKPASPNPRIPRDRKGGSRRATTNPS